MTGVILPKNKRQSNSSVRPSLNGAFGIISESNFDLLSGPTTVALCIPSLHVTALRSMITMHRAVHKVCYAGHIVKQIVVPSNNLSVIAMLSLTLSRRPLG